MADELLSPGEQRAASGTVARSWFCPPRSSHRPVSNIQTIARRRGRDALATRREPPRLEQPKSDCQRGHLGRVERRPPPASGCLRLLLLLSLSAAARQLQARARATAAELGASQLGETGVKWPAAAAIQCFSRAAKQNARASSSSAATSQVGGRRKHDTDAGRRKHFNSTRFARPNSGDSKASDGRHAALKGPISPISLIEFARRHYCIGFPSAATVFSCSPPPVATRQK